MLAPAVLLLCLAAIAAWVAWPRLRAARGAQRPLSPAWRQTLARNLPVYRRLPADLQRQLEALVQRFVRDKRFVGCADFVVDDEVRVTIAGTACLLLLNRPTEVFAGLHYILVYPDGFLVQRESVDEAGVLSTEEVDMLGESWDNGRVVLSWRDVIAGSRGDGDGVNVVLHEFAHQLDEETGASNGAPLRTGGERQARWARVFGAEYAALQRACDAGEESFIDPYGATDPAEFFAVVTEHFFEEPEPFAEWHPALYRELVEFYKVDPREWMG